LYINGALYSFLCVCSEGGGGGGGGGVVAYYQSEFDVHVLQQGALDEAIESLEPSSASAPRQSRVLLRPRDALDVNNVVSRGLTPPSHNNTAG